MAFTFVEAFEINGSWKETAYRAIRAYNEREPGPGEIEEWVSFIQLLLKDIQPGDPCVYFDGWVFPVPAKGIWVKGIHSMHNLTFIPQVAALNYPTVTGSVLSSSKYWQSTAI
jgi:hypothetical protein